jgi:hypothetical protein
MKSDATFILGLIIIVVHIWLLLILSSPFSNGPNADTFRKTIMLAIKGNHSNSSGLDEMEQGAFSCRQIC